MYQCPACHAKQEEFRPVDDRDDPPLCFNCAGHNPPILIYKMKRLIAYGVQIVASHWYEKEGIEFWPTGMGEKDKVEHRKKWDAENEQSWQHKESDEDDIAFGQEPVRSGPPQSAVDIYKNLTQEAVHSELAGMAVE